MSLCRPGRYRLLFVGILVAALSLSLSPSPESTEVSLTGLQEKVEILKDRWGVSHIYARNEHDLFFAQGFNAARDRLFQLEMWRRQATGTLSEIMGRKALAQDTGARLLRFRGDLAEELAHYHPRGETIIRAFVDGINSYIESVAGGSENLPVEFRLLGIRPEKWTPEVVVSRHNGLFRNASEELALASLLAGVGAEKLSDWLEFHPGDPQLRLDSKVNPQLFPDDLLSLYTASRSGPEFSPEDIVDPDLRRTEFARLSGVRWDSFSVLDLHDIGSNNWVVSAQRSLNGAPLLANDPHRGLQVPSLRYFAHLVAPGWDVIGGGEPALPGISIGHNADGAWGLTIFAIDQEDLMVYETNPDNPMQYRYGEGWESMRVEEETIPVEGEEPVVVQLKFTRHGPVLSEDPANHLAYALKAAWLEVGASPYLASLRMNQAKSWEEFREACRFSFTPSENMIWADRRGNIGWQAVGIAPIRPNWSGLLPVPGDGRYEWIGFVPGKQLPHRLNPPEGYWATANQDNVPPNYPYQLGLRWAEPFRHARIRELLSQGRQFSLSDFKAFQHDELSIPARTLVPLLLSAAGETPEPEIRPGFELLRNWDFTMASQSAAAALYSVWELELMEGVWRRVVPEEFWQKMSRRRSLGRLINWMLSPDGRFGEDPIAERDMILLDAFRRAQGKLKEIFGPDISTWRYGHAALHHVEIRHPLAEVVNGELSRRLNVGPRARGGNGTTVNMTTDRNNQSSGATFRVLFDLADWDQALATNSPGQSGDPDSDSYRDLFELWARGEYFPLFYSRRKIDGVTRSATVLIPQPSGGSPRK